MSWQDTILRQYSASERLINIIDTFDQAVSLDDFTDDFITDVWDLTTNLSFGLDVWGKIVNISRYVEAEIDSDSFGFYEANDPGSSSLYPDVFNSSPFYGGVQETTNVRLGDDAYRTLILAKAFSNISIATIPEINQFLQMLFKGRGVIFVNNYFGMAIGITTDFELAPYEKSILMNYDVMPIPSGVKMRVTQIVNPDFGFADDAYPFNEGIFYGVQ